MHLKQIKFQFLKLLQKNCKKSYRKKYKKIYFDRGKFKYHGRVKEFAETLRKNGMEF